MKIGVDLTFIPRFENKERLAKEVLSDNEYLMYENSTNKAQFLASRFALKEAFLKANELSILSIKLSSVEIIKKENGAIYIMHDNVRYECSLSHENEYCIGVVLYD